MQANKSWSNFDLKAVKKTFKQGNNATKRMITRDNYGKNRETEERKLSKVEKKQEKKYKCTIDEKLSAIWKEVFMQNDDWNEKYN